MASTYTHSVTQAFTRTELIRIQFRFFLAETIPDSSEQTLIKFIDQGLKEQWLGEIMIYALDSEGLCHGQISLKIDWKTHRNEIANGKLDIYLDKPWRGKEGNVSPGIDTTVRIFNEFVEEQSLKVIWRFRYASGINSNEMDKKLGANDGESIKWKIQPKSQAHSLSKIKEVSVEWRYYH